MADIANSQPKLLQLLLPRRHRKPPRTDPTSGTVGPPRLCAGARWAGVKADRQLDSAILRGMTTAEEARPKKPVRQRLITLLVQAAVLVFIFGILLPWFIDYRAVFDAIAGLSWWQFFVLLTLSVLRVPTEAFIYRALLPGLRVRVGTEAYLSQNFIGTFLPPPAPSVMQYAYFRSDGFDQRSSLTGAIGTFIFPTGGRMGIPLAAFLLLFLAGQASTKALIIALASLAVLAVVSVVVWFVGRSERSARWLGDLAGRLISWGLAKFNRDPVTNLGEMLVEFRNNTFALVRKRWRVGTMAVVINLVVSYLMLLACVRFVGLSNAEISWVLIFAVFAVSFFAGVVFPITGSGLGTVDAVMISTLSTLSGNGDLSAAAAFLWRVFYSFITVPFGVFTCGRFRRAHAHFLTDATSAFGLTKKTSEHKPGRSPA